MVQVLKDYGYDVRCTDIKDRGCPNIEIKDFLQTKENDRDIITNPPYKYAKEFVEHALEISPNGTRVAMLLKLIFLEGKGRRALFKRYPPKYIYVFSERILCALGGDFTKQYHSAMCYAWFVWEKGFNGEPIVRWLDKQDNKISLM